MDRRLEGEFHGAQHDAARAGRGARIRVLGLIAREAAAHARANPAASKRLGGAGALPKLTTQPGTPRATARMAASRGVARAMSAPSVARALRFGVFELDLHASELRRSGHALPLRPQALRLLVLLAERPGELVTREQARAALWGEQADVDVEQGLNDCVKEIRALLRDNARTPAYVETLPRRGYRFVAPVEVVGGSPPGPAPGAPQRRAIGCLASVVALVWQRLRRR
jgi:DNA-binding winged helix-turn-helix (wHTH) protein